VLRDNERDTHIDVYEPDHVRCLCFVSICKMSTSSTVRTGAPGREQKTGTPRVEAHVGLSHSSEEGFDELVDVLPGLACQISETGLECRVHW
jgi:hypothetical protein